MMHLSASGLYKDAKILKAQVKELKIYEKEKALKDARAKLLRNSQMLISRH